MRSWDTGPISLNSPGQRLPDEHRRLLLKLASDSIAYGLRHDSALPVDLAEVPRELREQRATFVTLQIRDNLRGCIGMLEARRPLATDVAENAFAAAFEDTRFLPLTPPEFGQLDIHISVLSPLEPMTFESEADFLGQLRPGVDGIVIEEGFHRGTFLPSVWEQLPDREEFLRHLKLKAGLPTAYWSPSIRAQRYTTECFPSPSG